MSFIAGLADGMRERVQGAIAAAELAGMRVRVTSGYRSIREQQRLYDAWIARGRTGLPAAAPGRSTHNFGIGIDLVIEPTNRTREFATLAECFGLIWAGAKDWVHYDPFGFDGWRRLLAGQDPEVEYRC